MKKIIRLAKKTFLMLIILLVVLLGVGAVYEHVSETSDNNKFPAPGKIYDVGVRRMHLNCTGSGTPTVILEAGGASSSKEWLLVQEELSKSTQVCSYDRAGFGWSDPVLGGLTFEEGAVDLNSLLSSAGMTGPYVFVGSSKGGFHARTYARLYPSDVSGMILLDSAEEEHLFSQVEVVERSAGMSRNISMVSRFGIIRLALRFAPGILALPPIPEEIKPALFSELARPEYWKAASLEPFAYTLTPEEMRVLGGFGELGDTPLIVITHGIPFTGKEAFKDEGWLASMERLTNLSTNSELIVAEKSGHAIQWQEPDLVVDLVVGMISQINE